GVLDDHELALRHLPALDDLVRTDLALVRRAPALLADRRPALTVERPEADVGLLRLRRRRQSQADGNVDQAEADGSVPDGAHGAALNKCRGTAHLRPMARVPSLTTIGGMALAAETPVATGRTIARLWHDALARRWDDPAYLVQDGDEWREV